jgi:alpha-beta hydrolase superfamily lysophospholipase
MTDLLTTRDGLRLQWRDWPRADARGTVLIVHGLGEHIGRYAQVAEQLGAWGWRVTGYDHRGHGASEGPRGRLHQGDDLLHDLALVIDAVRQRHPGPLVLLGHSMGGAVAARFVAEGLSRQPASWFRAVDALVLSSPALDPGMSAVQKLLLTVLGSIAPDLLLGNGLNPAWVSRDPAVVQAYIADPLVHDRVSARLVRFIVDAGVLARQRAAQWQLPTLLMWAGADRCVAPSGSAAFAAAAPPDVVASRTFAPLFHEIFNEPERADVLAVLGAWLAQRSH